VTERELQVERRKGVFRKLRRTQPGETVCLAYWEVEVVLDYIKKLKGAANNGNAEIRTADSKGTDESIGRG
jgi:hypothetical protein